MPTERLREVDEPTTRLLRELWARAAAVDGVQPVSEAFRLAVGAAREGVVHLLRRGDDGAWRRVRAGGRRCQPGCRRRARRRPAAPAPRPRAGAPRRRPRRGGAQRLGARHAARRRGVGALGRPGADPQPAPHAAAAHVRRRRGCRSAGRLLGAPVRAGPGRRDLGEAQRGRLLPASGTGPAHRGRPARPDGAGLVRPGGAHPRRRRRDRGGRRLPLDQGGAGDVRPRSRDGRRRAGSACRRDLDRTRSGTGPGRCTWSGWTRRTRAGASVGRSPGSVSRTSRALGLDEVELYVDGDNTAARRTYERLGFTDAAVDGQYTRRDT